jgi:hypothetical protein
MSGFPRSETFLFQLHSFDQPVEKFPFAVNRAPRLEGPPRAASLPPPDGIRRANGRNATWQTLRLPGKEEHGICGLR